MEVQMSDNTTDEVGDRSTHVAHDELANAGRLKMFLEHDGRKAAGRDSTTPSLEAHATRAIAQLRRDLEGIPAAHADLDRREAELRASLEEWERALEAVHARR
jgi:hypothetical protein